MNIYIYEILLAAGLILGIISGFSAAILILRGVKKKPSSSYRHKKQRSTSEEKTAPSKTQKGLLRQRLGEGRDSWTEFNCSEDNMDANDYIQRSRKKEDNAYRIVKRRSKKKAD